MTARGTLVYVHGASDRGALVDDQVARIEARLAADGMPFDVVASRWGEAVGPTLKDLDLALPTSAAPAVAAHAAEMSALAALVREGPMIELARLATMADADPVGAAAAPGSRDADRLLAIARNASLAAADPDPAMAEACRAAALAVGESSEYARARCALVPEAELVGATARAVAATAASMGPAPVAVPAPAAVDVAHGVELRIAELSMAIALGTLLAGYLGIDLGDGLRRWATDVLVPHRARLMRDAFLGPADILVYLRAGGRIRGFVARTLRQAIARGGPVIALGNSLGGIVLVDILGRTGAPRPDLLVTVGSQSSLLHAVGADQPPVLVVPFQPWLNVYDRRDFLAFVAKPLWPSEPGITDVAVDSGLGFPDSHGATYLSNPETYAAIRAQLSG